MMQTMQNVQFRDSLPRIGVGVSAPRARHSRTFYSPSSSSGSEHSGEGWGEVPQNWGRHLHIRRAPKWEGNPT